MYRCNIVFYCIFFFVLCELNADEGGNILKKSESTVTSKHFIKNSTIFITTRFGSDGASKQQACECVPFFNCVKENYFEIPDNPTACNTEYVCCKVQTPLESDLDPTTSNANTENPLTSCRCVPQSQCQISSDERYGVGLIDPKLLSTDVSECTSSKDETCCPNERIKPVDSSKMTSTPQQLKCGERGAVVDAKVLAPDDSSSTVFGEFPWMASIWKTSTNSENEFVCGASLLSSNIVLTAAHCVHQEDTSKLKVRLGDYDIKSKTFEEPDPYQEKSISAVIVHPNFNSLSLFNDLAILIPTESFVFARHVFPVCTSFFGSEYVDSAVYDSNNCLATGWGKSAIESKENFTATLKKVDLRLVPADQCQQKLRTTRLKKFFHLDSSFICAGGIEGSDTCKGDGGGPLFCPLYSNRHQYVQIGVTSWGVGCGADIPGVYASLEASNAWLSSVYDKYKESSVTELNSDANFRRKL